MVGSNFHRSSFPRLIVVVDISFDVTDWPSSKIAFFDLARMSRSHTVQMLLVFSLQGNLIMPHDYDDLLPGALVHLRFSLNRYPSPLNNFFITHTFVTDIERVRLILRLCIYCCSHFAADASSSLVRIRITHRRYFRTVLSALCWH